jgi:glycosyltransferase involved in cell wall biosynthesis
MRVAIVGGIYGKSAAYRLGHRIAPETTLEDGLRQRGIDVSTFSHFSAIDCNSFDVVHVHHLSWGAVRVATDRSQAAFVFTPHNPQYMSESLPAHLRLAMRFVLRRADLVVALSGKEKTFQELRYKVVRGASVVIPNGIPANLFKSQGRDHRAPGMPWRILYVGQLNEIKRVDVLLEAVAQIPFPVIVTLAYQNAELETALRSLASRLGIAERVNFAGQKNPEELCRLYNSSDLLVLPSSGEALPSVITEAMLCGTPIVATDVGGIREQLAGFGIVVPPNNPKELALAIGTVLNHYHRFEGQARPMTDYARRTFSVDAMVDRHIDLYRQLSETAIRRRSHLLLGPGSSLARLGLAYGQRPAPLPALHHELPAARVASREGD